MTALVSRPLPHPDPSPSKSNPFARPKLTHVPSSFTRSNLLPTLPSPFESPAVKPANGTVSGTGSAGKTRQGWRLLWRGGLEVGKDGWRLDGITFFALLTFPPPTPSVQPISNPFDAPLQSQASPFPSLPSADTDLCLSLESMRGRKYLQIRGMVDLPEEEVLDGAEDGGGVQMSITPHAPLLAAYFTTLLCRHGTLSVSGRTLSAVLIGLGDEGVDSTHASTLLVYGQRTSQFDAMAPSTLRFCVARRKPPPPPPSERKIRPGEPLPRVPLFLPTQTLKKPPPPFPRRSVSISWSFSRTTSVASIYNRPPPVIVPAAPVSGRSPGRRGEKRPRSEGERFDDVEKRRKAGKIAIPRPDQDEMVKQPGFPVDDESAQTRPPLLVPPAPDEDIFGTRPVDATLDVEGQDRSSYAQVGGEPPSTGRLRRVRVPHQVLQNKAAVRKQTLLLMAERGVHREHEQFKDVFGMTTKGAYFAFRASLESGPLEKAEVQMIVKGHLGMYLAQDSMSPTEEGGAGLEMPDKSAQLDTKPRIEEAAKDHPDGLEPSALEADLSGEGEADLQLKQERPSTPEDPP